MNGAPNSTKIEPKWASLSKRFDCWQFTFSNDYRSRRISMTVVCVATEEANGTACGWHGITYARAYTHNGFLLPKNIINMDIYNERICRGSLFLDTADGEREPISIRICCRMQMLNDRNDSKPQWNKFLSRSRVFCYVRQLNPVCATIYWGHLQFDGIIFTYRELFIAITI